MVTWPLHMTYIKCLALNVIFFSISFSYFSPFSFLLAWRELKCTRGSSGVTRSRPHRGQCWCLLTQLDQRNMNAKYEHCALYKSKGTGNVKVWGQKYRQRDIKQYAPSHLIWGQRGIKNNIIFMPIIKPPMRKPQRWRQIMTVICTSVQNWVCEKVIIIFHYYCYY